MEKKPTYIETYGKLTPPKKAEPSGFISRLISRIFLNGGAVWKARPDNPQEAPLIDMVAGLCPKMGIAAPPELFIYTSPYPNAASTVTGTVMVSDNLLAIMTPEEVQSVMAHELAHHRHKQRDNTIMLGGVIAGGIAYKNTLLPKVNRLIAGIRNQYARLAATIAAPVAEFFAAVGLINLYQQKIEYESDRESAQATSPKIMIEALHALENRGNEIRKAERLEKRGRMSETQKVISDTVEKIEPKWLRRIRRNPFEVLGSHPPTRLRIEALEAQEARIHAEGTAPRQMS